MATQTYTLEPFPLYSEVEATFSQVAQPFAEPSYKTFSTVPPGIWARQTKPASSGLLARPSNRIRPAHDKYESPLGLYVTNPGQKVFNSFVVTVLLLLFGVYIYNSPLACHLSTHVC